VNIRVHSWLIRNFAGGLFAVLLGLVSAAWAEGGKPLTLAEALQAAEAPHPDLLLAEAERDAAQADQDLAAARQDLNVNFEAGLRRVKPSLPPEGYSHLSDNSARLSLRKSLYDFGRTASAEAAAKSETESRTAELLETRDRRRIDIMARFFDVLLADMQAAADNEFMAAAYVDFDNGRHRLEVGTLSPVELGALEALYQDLLVKRNASQQRQRVARALLAMAMNRPGELAPDLEDPDLKGNERPVPEYEQLLALLPGSPRLQSAQAQLEASRQRLEGVRADRNPTLEAELESAHYAGRQLSGRDDWRAGLVLNWPIYQGDRVDARQSKERARFQQAQARVEKLRMELTQALLENWLEIEQLRATARGAAKKNAEYRDLALERAQGEYEVELKTNLGTSMAATMEARVRERGTEYRLALALARLEALLGMPLEQAAKNKESAK